ncbi:hypothetical protein ACS0TY_014497 [Phlomoides rotata]
MESRGKGIDLGEDNTLHIDEEENGPLAPPSMCLIEKVLTNKPFNAYGLLETMKKAMNPLMGFTAREIGKNLFSFQFRTISDMRSVLSREPWTFDKNILMLQELDGGEQPSAIAFARSEKIVRIIASRCGDVVDIDSDSMKGLSRSVRVKVSVNVEKPMKQGLNLELHSSKSIWVNFKYERLPSFCYFCGMFGHMKRECDLVEGEEIVTDLPDEKLPFGEWMRASPSKKATVITKENKTPKFDTSI